MILVIIALSLSMDAFSLSLAYGTLKLDKKTMLSLSFIVGMYHFVMPIIGMYIGDNIINVIKISPNLVVTFVLSLIGLNMIIDSFKKEEVKVLKRYELFVFGLAVSIDSFTAGITLKTLSDSIYLGPFLFCISSFIFTFVGLNLGNTINKLLGSLAAFLGGLTLIIIGLNYIV